MKISDLRYEYHHIAEFVFHFVWLWSFSLPSCTLTGVEVPPWLLSVASTSRGWTYQNLNLIDQFVFSKTAVIAGARDEQTSKGGRILSDEVAMEEYERGATEQVSTKENYSFILAFQLQDKSINANWDISLFLQVLWVSGEEDSNRERHRTNR